MKKFFKIFFVIAILCCCLGCKKEKDSNGSDNNYERGVVINGVKWATRNVGAPGTFASSLHNYGELYTFEEAQKACPEGWRLPTHQEIEKLAFYTNCEWVTQYGVSGRLYESDYKTLFLPAAGYFDYTNDTLLQRNDVGYYWCTGAGGRAAYFYCRSSNAGGGNYEDIQPKGFSIRCVAE